MKKHEFNLKCNDFSILNYDISISGLGWFSVSGKGFCQLIVSVPENVKVTLRKKALMPYEVKFKGLKKYFGNTINKDSKINRKFNINSNFKKNKAEDNTNKRVNNFSKEEINKNI